jgi:hypothetical protein
MAYVDKNLEFSDAQAVTATAISSNVYDTLTPTTGAATLPTVTVQNARLDIGVGDEDLWLVVNTQTTATDSGSDATLAVTFETADDVGLSTNATVLATSGTLAFATFATAGTNLLRVKLPSALYRRYIGVRYTVASGPLTAGNFDAYITTTPDANRIYKSAFTVQ